MVLDYPLGIRPGWSPPEFWQAGMFLTVAGSALVAVAAIRADCISRRTGGALLVAAVVLALELVPGIDPTDEGVDGGFLQLLRYDKNWFSTHPMPLIAGLIFGLAWLSIALANRRPRVLREGAVRGGTGRRRP